MGSNVNFEVAPFFPFKEEFETFTAHIKSTKKKRKTASTVR